MRYVFILVLFLAGFGASAEDAKSGKRGLEQDVAYLFGDMEDNFHKAENLGSTHDRVCGPEGEKLLDAVQRRQVNTVVLMLLAGCSANTTYKNGQSILHHAVQDAQVDVIREDGSRGLSKIFEPSLEVVQVLLASAADVWARDNRGYTALHTLVEVLVFAFASGADKVHNEKNELANDDVVSQKSSPTNFIIMKLLIDAGLSVDARDNKGYTALMIAANQQTPDRVRDLLKLGADATLKNEAGKTALDLARRFESITGPEVVRIIKEHLKTNNEREDVCADALKALNK